MDTGNDSAYTLFRKGGKNVCAMYLIPQEMRSLGIPPVWQSRVSVDSANGTASEAEKVGGVLLQGPFDVPDAGRMAVVQDPAGARGRKGLTRLLF